MYYVMKEHNLSLLERDDRGSTPLHWATYSKSEIAILYILSWMTTEQLDARDMDGYTALHLAVKAVQTSESTRAVRALLIQGASRDVKDNKGKTPLDLAIDINNPRL